MSIRKTTRQNKNILVSNKANFKHQKHWLSTALSEAHASPEKDSMKNTDEPIKKTILPTGYQKMLVGKDNDEKLAATLSIVRTGITSYHFGTIKTAGIQTAWFSRQKTSTEWRYHETDWFY